MKTARQETFNQLAHLC